jgi:hypothetical protein
MIRLVRAYVAVLAALLERWASRLSEDAKTYPNRQFYAGYEQGVRDGFDGAEHAIKWLASKEKKA